MQADYHPENLKVGSTYRFKYKSYTKTKRVVRGVFKGMDIQYGSLWLYFREDGDKKNGAFEPNLILSIEECKCND